MSRFAARVDGFWRGVTPTSSEIFSDDVLTVIVDPASQESRDVSIVRRVAGSSTIILSPDVGGRLQIGIWPTVTESLVLDALTDAGIELYDADNLFYFDEAARQTLVAERDAPIVRKLEAGDSREFARFEASASDQDREDSFVELDHWAVFGAFDGDRLAAAASAYPWGGAQLADIGILTLTEFRGRGFAKSLVRGLSRNVLDLGHEPQYRCQLDNAASVALAKSCGLTMYGTWQTVVPASPA